MAFFCVWLILWLWSLSGIDLLCLNHIAIYIQTHTQDHYKRKKTPWHPPTISSNHTHNTSYTHSVSVQVRSLDTTTTRTATTTVVEFIRKNLQHFFLFSFHSFCFLSWQLLKIFSWHHVTTPNKSSHACASISISLYIPHFTPSLSFFLTHTK